MAGRDFVCCGRVPEQAGATNRPNRQRVAFGRSPGIDIGRAIATPRGRTYVIRVLVHPPGLNVEQPLCTTMY